MADPQYHEGSSTGDVSGGSFSESTLELKIKTLDSRIYSFHVDKNIVVSAFKEEIASQSGVPVGQQRLIFRGKVLKDDLTLSEYHVENGDTLHLVERQTQSSAGTRSNSGETTSSNGNRGQDSSAGQSQNRIGHISHNVVLGTLNVGGPGEAAVSDIGQVIGAVLNSIGIGNLGGVQPGVPASHANETEGSRNNAGGQNHAGGQSVPLQALHGQSASPTMQIPVGAAFAIPTLNMPIPDSLDTLIEFMNRMELALQSGNQPNQSPAATDYRSTTQLPRSSRGLPTVEALSIVLQQAHRLLSSHAVPALSHMAGRLGEEGGSTDPAVRGQVQTESTQLGVAMQHLGSLLLELGRTLLTLRMGQSPAESFVNAGPAVYISSSGPNPIMVQPFPLQTSSLFGGLSGAAPNPVIMGPVGVGSVPRNVNIHIHTGPSLATIVPRVGSETRDEEGTQGQSTSGTGSGDSAQARALSGLNVGATVVPLRPTFVPVTGVIPPGTRVPQAPDSSPIFSRVAQINSQLRSLIPNMQNGTQVISGQSEGLTDQPQFVGGVRDNDINGLQKDMSSSRVGETSQTSPHVTVTDDQKAQTVCHQSDGKETEDLNSNREISSSSRGTYDTSKSSEHAENFKSSSRPNQGNSPDSFSGVPLGLGLGGLQPKKRGTKPKGQSKNSDGASTSSQNQQARADGRQVLQSLTSLSTRGNVTASSGQLPTRQTADNQIDVADAMSQFLENPAMNGLLSGVAQQTGVGSPDMFRNMLHQFTQIPAMRNTVNQLAQQMDSHGLGDMISDLGRGQGGGIDLSRMVQQMMPIVSQALGGVSSAPQVAPPMETLLAESMSRREASNDPQIDLRPVIQRLANRSSSQEIFRAVADNVVEFLGNGSVVEGAVNELCSEGGLMQEFMEMLQNDVSRRYQDQMGS